MIRAKRTHQNDFLPFGADTNKDLKVNARHWMRQDRDIFLVEEVVDDALKGEIGPREKELLLEFEVVHKVGRKFAGEGYVVAGHSETLGVVTPLIQQRPRSERQSSRNRG